MGPFSFFFILSLVLLFVQFSEAKDPVQYWNKIMKGEPMPKAIQELFYDDLRSLRKEDGEEKGWEGYSATINMRKIKRNFDTRANLIIYHKHHGNLKHEKMTQDKALIESSKIVY